MFQSRLPILSADLPDPDANAGFALDVPEPSSVHTDEGCWAQLEGWICFREAGLSSVHTGEGCWAQLEGWICFREAGRGLC